MTEKEKALKSLEICMFNTSCQNCCNGCYYFNKKEENCMKTLYKDIKKIVNGDEKNDEKEKIIKELIRIRDGFTPDPYMTVEDDIFVIANSLIYIIKNASTPPDLRPCIVNGRKAYFHNWENVQKISHSFMGNVEGQVAYTAGLVEFEDGQMQEVEPNDIKFTDRKQSE